MAMGSINVNNGRVILTAKPGKSLLAALSEGKVFIPSACGGQGRCGLCAVKLMGTPEAPLTAPEKALLPAESLEKGMRLSCQVKAGTDLSIEIPEDYFSIRRYTGKLTAKVPMTQDILNLHIQLLTGQSMEFKAGQYIQLRSPAYDKAMPVMRAYSLANRPSQKDRLELVVRRVRNGICTTWIFDRLKEGDSVQLSGPYGKFCLTCSIAPIVMIAGGSGMAPMLSILGEILEKQRERKIVFFFGAQKREDLFKLDEIALLAKELRDFTFVPALSSEPAGSLWSGERGLVTEVAAKKMGDPSGHEAYLCGSPGMVAACVKLLKSKGIPEDRIFYDKF
jgi:Na+-transporting NADH:ubiquinone oxidoreductase subunit F